MKDEKFLLHYCLMILFTAISFFSFGLVLASIFCIYKSNTWIDRFAHCFALLVLSNFFINTMNFAIKQRNKIKIYL